MDLDGNVGSDLFAAISPTVLESANNAGAATATASFADISSVEARDYKLRFDGAVWNISDANTGAALTVTGTGTGADPFVVDGMEIVIGGGAAVAGDEFRVRPSARAASGVSVVMTDANQIAAARLLDSAAQLSNVGDATISTVTVGDATNPNLLDPITIVFDDPPSTYTVVDGFGPVAGPLPYGSGNDITVNGWVVQISGTPAGQRRVQGQSKLGWQR